MDAFEIEVERPDDVEAVAAVLRLAFATQPGVPAMVAAIRASDHAEPDLTLVARAGGQVTGFVMLSHVDLVEDTGARHDALTLSPLGVRPADQRRGIGSALVRRVVDLASARVDLPRVVTLEGDPGYYGRLGFEFAPDRRITIDLPGWASPAAAQVLLLPGYDPSVRGAVRYPPAFLLADQ